MSTLDWSTAATTSGFGTWTDADELLHGTGPAGDSLTETWYWGFNVPAARINCYAYCWVHPNLGVVSAGLFVYQGIKRQHLAAELFDLHGFVDAATVGDGSDVAVANGFRARVVAPMRSVRLTFDDPARETSVDVLLSAAAPPVMRANGQHFEQVMRTTGTLVLRGERHHVDSWNVRDRSWGELRPESHNPGGPYNWVTGVTADGTHAFNLGSVEDAAGATAVRDGWIGPVDRPRRIVTGSKRIERDPLSLRPTTYLIQVVDDAGADHEVRGEIVAGLPWGGWHNMICHLGLVRWEIDGGAGWGDSMECQWNDFVWRSS